MPSHRASPHDPTTDPPVTVPLRWRLDDGADPAAPSLPGWETRRRLATGPAGDLHLAHADGRWAVLRVLPADRPDVLAAARAGSGIAPHPHLVRTRRLARAADGRDVAVLDLVDGGTLADHVAARGRLLEGEVVTVAAALTDALTHLHRHGVGHGGLDADHVLLTPQGRPLLGDPAGARARRPVAAPVATPRDDLVALGTLVGQLLTGPPLEPARTTTAPHPQGPVADAARGLVAGEVTAAARARDLFALGASPLPLRPGDVDDPSEAVTRRIPERFLHGGYRPTVRPGTPTARRRTPAGADDGDALRRSFAVDQTSKEPSSRRFFSVVRKRPASAPSTTRWS